MHQSALITGTTGQHGSYLSEFLLEKGYDVQGIIRRASSFNTDRIDHVYQHRHERGRGLILHYGDLTDATVLRHAIEKARPQEVDNLGAQSHVKVSFEEPEQTADVVAMETLRLLDCVRSYQERVEDRVQFYQAGSLEVYGATPSPQDEHTPFQPRSLYAVSKVAAHWYGVITGRCPTSSSGTWRRSGTRAHKFVEAPPARVGLDELVTMMVDHDLELARQEAPTGCTVTRPAAPHGPPGHDLDGL